MLNIFDKSLKSEKVINIKKSTWYIWKKFECKVASLIYMYYIVFKYIVCKECFGL